MCAKQEHGSLDEPADDRKEHTWQSINDKHNYNNPPNWMRSRQSGLYN
jgi:hypothetical protein